MRLAAGGAALPGRRIFRHVLLLFSLFGIAACGKAADPYTTKSLAADYLPRDRSLTFSGEALHAGVTLDWTLIINGDGRALSTVSGSYSAMTGFDGETVWRIENGAGPFNVEFAEREVWLMALRAMGRQQPPPTTPAGGNGEAATTRRMRLPGGLLEFEWASANRLVAANSPAGEAIDFSADDVPGHAGIPRSFRIENIGEISAYRVESAKEGPAVDASRFARPPRRTDGFRFLPEAGAELETRQAGSGHLFVRPLIDGRDVGWFLFDSGAGFSGLNGELAVAAGFERVGSKAIEGIGGVRPASARYVGGPVQLGPLLIDSLAFTDVGEMDKARQVLGEPVVGVLGWDILIRAIVEVDLRDGRLFLHDPGRYRAPAEHRQPLFIHWSVPYLRARFAPGHEAPFMFDTGAGNRGVIFTHFSGRRFDLLEGRAGVESSGMGAGGPVTRLSGEIEWFEVAGHRTAPAPAMFITSEDNEADLFTAGFLGGAVVAPFRITLDYGRGEAGFVPRRQP